MRQGLVAVSLAAAVLAGTRFASANLAEYVGKPNPELKWSKVGESQAGEVKVINLKVESQVWRGIPWEHSVQVYLPKKLSHPKTAALLITGGSPGLGDSLLAAALAPRLEAPLVILYNIPNQPLFEGKKEDDLIAHTFQEYLQSEDESWPLLFPMVKSTVRAMDAVQALSRKEWATPVEDFMVTGASKRGWTTWLTAASDKRVRAIAPMVFDNLNFNKQMPRQLELWGKYSEQIEDYSRRGLQQKMESPVGKKLVSMVDPWYYRQKLTMPKLIVNGANDRYWATDATRAYWDDLAGDKYLLQVPNAGHGLEDRDRVLNSITAFFHATASDRPMPKLSARSSNGNGKVTVRLAVSQAPAAARLWTAKSDTLDFRPVKWEAIPMRKEGEEWVAEAPLPPSGGLATFTEAEYESDGRKFTLSTPATVYPEKTAKP